MTIENIVAIISAFGVGAVLKESAVQVFKFITGRGGARRRQIDTLVAEIVQLKAERDSEETRRRRYQEYTALLRLLLIELGFRDRLPPDPDSPSAPTPPTP